VEITIKLYRRERTQDGHGTISVPNGTLTGEILLEIDRAKLILLMGPRALRSKAKRSTLAGGAIVAKAVNLRKGDV